MQLLHKAKIIITNDKTPIFNGAILLEDFKVSKIGHIADFGDLDNFEVIDHGDSLICPGFINLHAHLLYSKANKINGSNGLFPWLSQLVDVTSNWVQKDYTHSIKHGITQALSTGTTFIVDNTPSKDSISLLSSSPLNALIGLEVFGSDELQAKEIFEDKLSVINDKQSDKVEITFSPHAPYDVSLPLWKLLIDWSNKNDSPLLTHLEESKDEKLWWQKKSGQAIDFWKKINKLEPKLKYWRQYNSGIDFLNKNELLTKNFIATHLCQASHEDLTVLKQNNVSAVHCPRSNYYLNNGTANLNLWKELGIPWGLGTDSTASNESLDLLEELRFSINQQAAVYNHKITPKEAFEAITLTSGEILSKDIGCLKNGFQADFLIYNIDFKHDCTNLDPYELIVFNLNNEKDLKEVWINGKKAWMRQAILHKII